MRVWHDLDGVLLRQHHSNVFCHGQHWRFVFDAILAEGVDCTRITTGQKAVAIDASLFLHDEHQKNDLSILYFMCIWRCANDKDSAGSLAE